MKLSIVIVNWNTADLLLKCLTSVYQNSPSFSFEVIVVDNASSDGSSKRVKAEFPQVICIASDKNLGFGPGNNLGIQQAEGQYILLLNPDTEVIGPTLQTCVDYLEQQSQQRTAVMGIKQREPSGKLQESCGHFPSLKALVLQAIFDFLIKAGHLPTARKLGAFFNFEWMPLKAMYQYFDFNAVHEVDWVMGAFMLIRGNVLKASGGFDPYFKMYAEEIDLCYRIKATGWSVQFFPGAEILHYGGASTKGIALRADAMRCVAMIRFYIKNRGVLSAFIYRCLTFFASFLVLASSTAKSMLGKDKPIHAKKSELAKVKMKAAWNPSYHDLF